MAPSKCLVSSVFPPLKLDSKHGSFTWLLKNVVLEVKLRLSGLDSKHFADRYLLSSRFGIDTNEEWDFSHKNLQSVFTGWVMRYHSPHPCPGSTWQSGDVVRVTVKGQNANTLPVRKGKHPVQHPMIPRPDPDNKALASPKCQ